MSSYLTNLLTTTTSRYNSLRRTLLDNEADGDTEDDSHISRVLRAYYTEKGRPFPPWLPPDPNDRKAVTPSPYPQGNAGGYFTSAGGKSQYPGVQNPGGNRGSLSDLWDPPSQPQQAPAPAQPMSLRRGPGRAGVPQRTEATNTLAPPQARPLPSQRVGSYQSVQSQQRPGMEPSPPPSSSGSISGGTAQERLKQRLWGGGRSSPTPGGSPSPGLSQVGSRNPYDQVPAVSGGGYDGSSGDSRRYGRPAGPR